MANRARPPWWTLTALLSVPLWLSGCGPSIGPRTEDHVVFIRHAGVAARVAESKRVKVVVEKDGKTYTDTLDLAGFYVISPDLKKNVQE